MVERPRFPGSEDPIRPVVEEKVKPKAADNPASEIEDDAASPPKYTREDIGPRIGDPIEAGKEVAAIKEKLDADDVVPLLFPHKVSLQDKGLMHHWEPGVHLVPVSLAGIDKRSMHWWLAHNGVRRAGQILPASAAKATANEG